MELIDSVPVRKRNSARIRSVPFHSGPKGQNSGISFTLAAVWCWRWWCGGVVAVVAVVGVAVLVVLVVLILVVMVVSLEEVLC